MHSLIDELNVRAISAYECEDTSVLPGLRRLGAALAVHGIAENGGLVGGAVENLFFSRRMPSIDDAVAGYRWLGLDDVATLVARARDEYLRFRPTGTEDISDQDEALWLELDEEFFRIATHDRLEAAVAARLPEIDPR